ncbi:hypothetical protein ACP70R_045564 [Stipagrostis hirtigluma subsp. patula]
MASTSSSWALLLLLAVCLVAGADAVTVAIENMCNFTVWPAAFTTKEDDGPYGFELSAGRTGTFNFSEPLGRTAIWGRTDCGYDDSGSFECKIGDCGELACDISVEELIPRSVGRLRNPTVAYLNSTTAEADDYGYTILSSRRLFNLPMEFSCINPTGDRDPISLVRCMEPNCPDGLDMARLPVTITRRVFVSKGKIFALGNLAI